MAAITSFDAWLSVHDLMNYNDVYSLYRSVADVDEIGGFKTVRGKRQGQYIVSSIECDDELLLATENARSYFLAIIEMKYCCEMDIETFYAVNRADEKDNGK